MTCPIDRTGWQPGPWDDEPDRLEWTAAPKLCPTCHRPSRAPSAAPCVDCWGTWTPEQKAPWIHRLRHDPGLDRVRHRDPVATAPPTLAAYVVWLEAELAAKEAP